MPENKITDPTAAQCPRCNGSGRHPYPTPVSCEACPDCQGCGEFGCGCGGDCHDDRCGCRGELTVDEDDQDA